MAHILVITREFPPYVLGGISYHLSNLYEQIANKGHKVSVISGVCPQSERELNDEIPDIEQMHTVQFGYKKGYEVLFPIALWNFLRDFNTEEYDVCVSHTELPFEIDLPLVNKKHDCVQAVRPYIVDQYPPIKKVWTK